MVFSSFVFLLAFLPIVLLLYYLCPARLRNLVLLVFSLVFYAWGEPVYVLIMLFSIVFDYANGRLIEHFKNKNCPGKAKVAAATSKHPKVMINTPYAGSWFMASTESYVARLIADAGGDYIYKKNTSNRSLPIDLEEAYMLTDRKSVV